MATTKRAETEAPEQTLDVHPALMKLSGWDAKRRRWVHTDAGKEALALVNAEAQKRRAKTGETDSSLRSE